MKSKLLEALYEATLQAALRCNPTSLIEPCTDRRFEWIDQGCRIFITAGARDELDRITCSRRLNPDAGIDGGRSLCLTTPHPGCNATYRSGRCTPIPDAGPDEGRCESLP